MRLLDHDDATDGARPPSALVREQLGNQPCLTVDTGKERLDVIDAALHLDDQQRAKDRVPRHDVDRPALAVVAERVLEDAAPSEQAQNRNDGADDGRVSRVEQRVADAAAPARVERQLDLKRSANGAQGANRQLIEPAGLDRGDQLLADAGATCDIGLAGGFMTYYGAKQLADAQVLHPLSVGGAAYWPLTRALSRCGGRRQ